MLTTWFIKTVFYEFDLFMALSFFVPNGIAYVNIPIQDTIELTINIEKSIYSLVLLGLLRLCIEFLNLEFDVFI